MNKNIWFCRAYGVISFKKVYKKCVFGLKDELQKQRGLLKKNQSSILVSWSHQMTRRSSHIPYYPYYPRFMLS